MVTMELSRFGVAIKVMVTVGAKKRYTINDMIVPVTKGVLHVGVPNVREALQDVYNEFLNRDFCLEEILDKKHKRELLDPLEDIWLSIYEPSTYNPQVPE